MGRWILMVLVLAALLSPAHSTSAEPITNPNFEDTWARTDKPVTDGQAVRTWMWGPEPFTEMLSEPYAESPNGQRSVQYFDKSRMEISDPAADPASIWYVTNGLLSSELITGNMQLGNNAFEQRAPAEINVAGDANDANGPTYATFNALLDADPAALNATYVARLDRAGQVTQDGSLAELGITAAQIDDVTNHAIAAPFWAFMTSSGTVYQDGTFVNAPLFENPYFATGRPITEAYWAAVQVGGNVQDVLLQCFERRCLTYTPGNAPEWQVEAGNVGQHYYQWRYESAAPAPPPPPQLGTLNAHFIDVGQGDAALIWDANTTILVDTGNVGGDEVVPYLQSVGITDIDLLVGTHAHADHIGQFPDVLAAFPVANVWMNGDEHTSDSFEAALDAVLASDAVYHEPRAGETFDFGSVGIEIKSPATLTGDSNNDSIVMRLTYGDVRFLLTGDAEAPAEAAMLARGSDLDADILKVGHHGSATSTTEAFLDAVTPEVAIYSASASNEYDHPDVNTLSRLVERGIEVYGTDVNGNIYVTTDGATYQVDHQRRSEQPPLPPSGCVDINSASAEELQTIVHIGPERAAEIISLRPFASVEDLTRVSGLGESRMADIIDQGVACVGE